jgi:hypothetical protein
MDEYLQEKNRIIEEWYNNNIINLEERNELYTTIEEEIKEPDNYIDLATPLSSNNKYSFQQSYSLYNRNGGNTKNILFSKDNNFFNIKSYDSNYYIKYDPTNKKIGLINIDDINKDNKNQNETKWQIERDNTNYIRLKINDLYLNVSKNKKIVMNKSKSNINSTLWKVTILDSETNDGKYYIESVKFPGFMLEFSNNKLILNTGISAKNVCIFEPIIQTTNILYSDSVELQDLIGKFNTYFEDIIRLFTTNIEENYETINKNLQDNKVNTEISDYLKTKIFELEREEKNNANNILNFKENRNKYNKIKEDLSNINNKTTNLEDNIYMLNENNNYYSMKFKTIYIIRICFIIIAFVLFMSICKNIYKMF